MYDTVADFINVKDLLVSKAVAQGTPRVQNPHEVWERQMWAWD
jgi:hypothetical protein